MVLLVLHTKVDLSLPVTLLSAFLAPFIFLRKRSFVRESTYLLGLLHSYKRTHRQGSMGTVDFTSPATSQFSDYPLLELPPLLLDLVSYSLIVNLRCRIPILYPTSRRNRASSIP